MKNTLLSLAMTATLSVASASASAAFLDFTVNEGVIAGTPGSSFTADKLTGSYSEYLGITAPGEFSASAIAVFTAYKANEGVTSPSAFSYLSANTASDTPGIFYQLYAKFTATGIATSNTTFIGTGGYLEIWLDPDSNTKFGAPGDPGFTSFENVATAQSGAAGDILVATSNVSYGTGDLIGPPGAFDIFFKNLQLTAFGQSYWSDLDTFGLIVQTNGDIDTVNPNPGSNPPPYFITGDVSAVFGYEVPEPGSLALIGAALAGLGVVQRRRNK